MTEFVWPYGQQADPLLMEYLVGAFESVRKTGDLGSSTGFEIPNDRMHWSNHVRDKKLVKCAEEYERYPDDGKLKFFCFGLHSIDYERANCWDVLEEFAERFGGRDGEFYYAPVRDIFRYSNAVDALRINGNVVENPSDITLYITVDGEKITVPPASTLKL